MPKRNDRQRANVYSVAERAGVSIATVSRVLRDSAPVAPETRRRVLDAARELDWRPSRLAQAMAQQTHDAVGIVFPDLAGPYYSQVIRGFEHEAVERSCAVLILGTHGREHAEDLVHDLADRVDGLVVMGRTVPDDVVETLDRADRPMVLLARPPVGEVPAVRASNLGSADALTRHVLDHGRRRPIFLGDPELSADVSERWRGFRRALRRHGLPVPSKPVPCGGFESDHGYKAAVRLFGEDRPPDVVVCANDEVASGVLLAAAASDLDVPGDVAVTGWDDIALAARLEPPLTTVHQPMRDLGARAAALLFDRIDGRPGSSVVLRTSVVVRESCGCRPQAAGTGTANTTRGKG